MKTEGRCGRKRTRVELRRGQPLHVEDVRVEPVERAQAERMLRRLERQPQARASEDPRRKRIEELAPPVAVGYRRFAETEMRRDELDIGARARERGSQLVVVRRGEGRRIGEQDAHGS